MAATDHGIVIGINHYPGIGSLRGPVNDARKFHQWLTDPEGGAVPEENIKLILSEEPENPVPIEDAYPNHSEISKAFRDILRKIIDSDEGYVGGRLYLFFSGHGYSIREVVALITANSERFLEMAAFPGSEAAATLARAGAFDEILLFMDCCRDDFSKLDPSNPTWFKILNPNLRETKKFYAFSTKWSRKAREVENNGEFEGIFTRNLLKGLRGASADAAGNIYCSNLENYVYAAVLNDEGNKDKQKPEFQFDNQNNFLITKVAPNQSGTEVCLTVSGGGNGKITIYTGMEELVQTIDFQEGKATTILPRGVYEAKVEGSAESALFKVTGKEGIHVTI